MRKLYLMIVFSLTSFCVVSQQTDLKIQWSRDTTKTVEEQKQALKEQMAAFEANRKIQIQQAAALRLAGYLSNNRIDTLKEVDLRNTDLEKIPDFLKQATALKILHLDESNIYKLPRYFKKLNLEKIYWSNNKSEKRISFPKMNTVNYLSYGGSQAVRLPSFAKLSELNTLNLMQSGAEDIPVKQLKRNIRLETLILYGSPIKLNGGNYDQLVSLKVLKINKSELESLHPDVYKIPNLSELQLQENKLQMLPEGISAMKNLTKVSLYKNEIQKLPIDFFEIPELVVADFYYNLIETISPNVGKADKMEILFLAHNRIYDLPEEIGDMENLDELYLHHNRISALPASLSNLKGLQVLRVNNNYLTQFPTQVLELNQLNEIDLDNNEISMIPTEVENLEMLKLFTFSQNPVDFEAKENMDLAQTLYKMNLRGTICKPNVLLAEEEEMIED